MKQLTKNIIILIVMPLATFVTTFPVVMSLQIEYSIVPHLKKSMAECQAGQYAPPGFCACITDEFIKSLDILTAVQININKNTKRTFICDVILACTDHYPSTEEKNVRKTIRNLYKCTY